MTPLKSGLFLSAYVLSVCSVHYYPNYDENLKKIIPEVKGKFTAFRLPNELDVIIHQSSRYSSSSSLSLSVGVGLAGVSREFPMDDDPIEGIAHLVEHCLFDTEMDSPFLEDTSRSTISSSTFYGLNFKEPTSELLSLFVQPFINQKYFIESFFQREIEAINHEWATKSHLDARADDRYPQLLMTQGHPAQIFEHGNRDTLMRSDILEKIWSFLGKHYKTKYMKLAVTLSPSIDISLMESLIIDNFSKIPPSFEVQPPLAPNANNVPPFWSVDHSSELVKIYSKHARRNRLSLYWYAPCDETFYKCDLILSAMISVLKYKLHSRNFLVSTRSYGSDHYILEMSTRLRDKELGNVDRIVGNLIAELKSIKWKGLDIQHLQAASNILLQNKSELLSYSMLNTCSIYDGPVSVFLKRPFDNDLNLLIIERLESLSTTDPRVAVVMKSSYLGMVDLETLTPDPHYPHYYTFEPRTPLSEPSESHEIASCTSKVTLSIHVPLPYHLQYQCGLFMELIKANLKEKGVFSTLQIEDKRIIFVIHLHKPELWKDTMQLVMSIFKSTESSFESINLDKIFDRQIREIKHAFSSQNLYEIAYHYAELFTTPTYEELSVLASDPAPTVFSIEHVESIVKVGTILQANGRLNTSVTVYYGDKSILRQRQETIVSYVNDHWNAAALPIKLVKFHPPLPNQSFIYVPSVVEGSDNILFITFDTTSSNLIYVNMLALLLNRFITERVRYQMNLAYHIQGGLLPSYRLFIFLQSAESPKCLYDAFNTSIEDFPAHTDTLTTAHLHSVAELMGLPSRYRTEYCGEESINNIRQIFHEFILPSGSKTSTLIIQIWSHNWAEEREKYVNELEQDASPNTKVFTTIDNYPRDIVDQ